MKCLKWSHTYINGWLVKANYVSKNDNCRSWRSCACRSFAGVIQNLTAICFYHVKRFYCLFKTQVFFRFKWCVIHVLFRGNVSAVSLENTKWLCSVSQLSVVLLCLIFCFVAIIDTKTSFSYLLPSPTCTSGDSYIMSLLFIHPSDAVLLIVISLKCRGKT